MKTIEYRSIDKSTWGPGPWQTEPDKRQWLDAATGLPCIIRRHFSFGSLCGYVAIPRGHPAFRALEDDLDVSVHGGLTFSGSCDPEGDPALAICHVVEPGEDDDVFWFGFDCGHYLDVQPGMDAMQREDGRRTISEIMGNRGFGASGSWQRVYRDWAYVTGQVESLATQLAAMRGQPTLDHSAQTLLTTLASTPVEELVAGVDTRAATLAILGHSQGGDAVNEPGAAHGKG